MTVDVVPAYNNKIVSMRLLNPYCTIGGGLAKITNQTFIEIQIINGVATFKAARDGGSHNGASNDIAFDDILMSE